MTTSVADKDLRFQIQEIFDTGVLSDLTITCGGHEFKVHKFLLYVQSQYFRKLFGGPFQDANTTTIDLPDDDPDVFRVLIWYFYKNELKTSFTRLSSRQMGNGESKYLIHVYAMADKYDVPSLRSLIVRRLSDICDPLRDEVDFVRALSVVDSCTAEDTIWDLLLPRAKAGMQILLQNELFQQIISEQPALSLRLLGSFAPPVQAAPSDKTTVSSPLDSYKLASKRLRTSEDEDGLIRTDQQVRLLVEEVEGFEARLADAKKEAKKEATEEALQRLEKFREQAKERDRKQNSQLSESKATIGRLLDELEDLTSELDAANNVAKPGLNQDSYVLNR